MQETGDGFQLLDLASQAEAVQVLLNGRSVEEKIAWLKAHGRLSLIPVVRGETRKIYAFESKVGLQCAFFISGESLVFINDNTTWSVPKSTASSHDQTLPPTGSAGMLSRILVFAVVAAVTYGVGDFAFWNYLPVNDDSPVWAAVVSKIVFWILFLLGPMTDFGYWFCTIASSLFWGWLAAWVFTRVSARKTGPEGKSPRKSQASDA